MYVLYWDNGSLIINEVDTCQASTTRWPSEINKELLIFLTIIFYILSQKQDMIMLLYYY